MTTANSDLVLHCDRVSLATAPLHSDMTGDSEHDVSKHDLVFFFPSLVHCDLVRHERAHSLALRSGLT